MSKSGSKLRPLLASLVLAGCAGGTVPAGVNATGGGKSARSPLIALPTLLPGGRGLTITGQLGEVMQESARAAQSYLWSHAADFGIDPEIITSA